MILLRNEPKILTPIPKRIWSPSLSLPKDQLGNDVERTKFRIRFFSNDGVAVWTGWFDDRDDFDAFLWATVSGTLKQERALWDLPTPNWQPWMGELITYDFATVVFLTATGANNWADPGDFLQGSGNRFDCIGAGGSGASQIGINNTTGGGGGGWSSSTNLTVTFPLPYNVGTGGTAITRSSGGGTAGNAGGDTTINTTTIVAKGGGGGRFVQNSATGGDGGAAASGTGTTKASGGRGGNGTSFSVTATGGGGAAGPGSGNSGAGAAGNNGVDTSSSASTGGGSGGGGSGGSAGSGGTTTGGAGGNGTEYSASYGSGGGGGGALSSSGSGPTGGTGGTYGAGGGAAASNIFTTISGAGRQGMVYISYTPKPKISFNMPMLGM